MCTFFINNGKEDLWLGWEVTDLKDIEVSFVVEALQRDIFSEDEDDVPCIGNFFRSGEALKYIGLLYKYE